MSSRGCCPGFIFPHRLAFSWFFLCQINYDYVMGISNTTLWDAGVLFESRGEYCYFCVRGGRPMHHPCVPSGACAALLVAASLCCSLDQSPVCCPCSCLELRHQSSGPIPRAQLHGEPRPRTTSSNCSHFLFVMSPALARGFPSPPARSRAQAWVSLLCVCRCD